MELAPGGQITHIDVELMRLRMALTPGQRIQAMLDTHEWIVAVIRGRLNQQYPDLSDYDIGLKIVDEIERSKRREFRPHLVLPRSAKARGT